MNYIKQSLLLISMVFVFGCAKHQPFTFAVLSDTHIMEGTEAEKNLKAAVQDINQRDIQFVIVSGDITDMNIGSNLQVAKTVLDELNCPYYIIPGNHDTKWTGSGGQNFDALWGDDRFVFDYGYYTFIGLHQGPVVRMDDGHFAQEDLTWVTGVLENLQQKNRPLIFITHYPMNPSVDNWYAFHERIKSHNVRLIIHGHHHRNKYTNYEGIPAVMVRSTLERRNQEGGYNIVEVRGDSIYFFERNYSKPLAGAWCKLSLKQVDSNLKPNTAPLPDYSINDQYGEIKTIWKKQLGHTTTATPLLSGERIFIGSGGGRMSCLSLNDGSSVWNFDADDAIYATAALSDNILVFTSTDSSIYALNSETGSLIWRHQTGDANIAVPIIDGKTVYVGGSDGHFRALDLERGETIWKYSGVEEYIENKPLVHNGKVIFSAWDETVYTLNKIDGKLIWKWKEGRPGKLYSPAACWPVVSEGKIFIVAPDRFMTAIDIRNGKTAWRSNHFTVRENVGISENKHLIFGRCMRDTLFAVSAKSRMFKPVWSINCDYGYDIAPSMPVEKNGIVYFGTKNGLIVAVNTEGPEIHWKYKLSNALINTVCPVNEHTVLVSDMDGQVALIGSGRKK